jgi:hypothetical protein
MSAVVRFVEKSSASVFFTRANEKKLNVLN